MTQEEREKNKTLITKEVLRTVKNFQPKQEQPKFMTHVQKDTAVLLKEKGFDLPTKGCYEVDGKRVLTIYPRRDFNTYAIMHISAPTLYEAAEWLREKGVHVQVGTYHYNVGVYYWESTVVEIEDGKYHQVGMFDTHDLALEDGIVHALKHYVK